MLHVSSPDRYKHIEYINSHEIIASGTKVIIHVLNDKIIFYPKSSTCDKEIQADIQIHNQMRIKGKVPDLSTGEYFVSLRSTINETHKLKEDLSFTIL